ncbi:hypothetical protein [Streptomyces sp. NPDC047981]|uniref:hypothetical protein n=1 Tax=Streptomyces sp. NPDC047981 TaxID=3154610 RepID=UPI00343A548F
MEDVRFSHAATGSPDCSAGTRVSDVRDGTTGHRAAPWHLSSGRSTRQATPTVSFPDGGAETTMQMNDTYQMAIDGTLKSSGNTPLDMSLTFHNMTPVWLSMYEVANDGTRWGWNARNQAFYPGQPGQSVQGASRPGYEGGVSTPVRYPTQGCYWLFTNAFSGAFVAVFETPTDGTTDVYITDWDLLEPNDIGAIPEPDADAGIVIPTDSPRIVVGCGVVGPPDFLSPNLVVREQCWQRLPNSYSIAPGETKESSYTLSSGRQNTTSRLDTLEASVSAAVGGGWGPVSASVSGSLSAASTSFQQLMVTEQTTSYVSEKYSLDTDAKSPEMMLYWQLADIVTVYDWGCTTTYGSVVTGTQPVVIGGPYELPDSAHMTR